MIAHCQMVVATGAHLFYFEIKQKQIVLIKQVRGGKGIDGMETDWLIAD